MKPALPCAIALVCLLAACWHNGTSTSVTTTVDEHGTLVEATLRGASANVTVDGVKIAIESGSVLVDGVSYGAVPKRAEVRYVVKDNVRTLTVDGETRTPAH